MKGFPRWSYDSITPTLKLYLKPPLRKIGVVHNGLNYRLNTQCTIVRDTPNLSSPLQGVSVNTSIVGVFDLTRLSFRH